jgi:hypothetical protein
MSEQQQLAFLDRPPVGGVPDNHCSTCQHRVMRDNSCGGGNITYSMFCTELKKWCKEERLSSGGRCGNNADLWERK